MNEIQVAYQWGFEASRAGRSMDRNPYGRGPGQINEWSAWQEGFVAGEDSKFEPEES